MPDFYDTQGRPLTLFAWAKLSERRGDDDRWWRVGRTSVGDARISTVWLGLDHRLFPGGPPLIFETLVFGGELDGEMERYSTWQEAEHGHARMVERVRANA